MERLTLLQWRKVLSEFLQTTSCSLFEGVNFMTDKYGEPNTEDNVLQDFEVWLELD